MYESLIYFSFLFLQSYVVCELHEKLDFLHSFIRNHIKSKILVFVSSCKQVRKINLILDISIQLYESFFFFKTSFIIINLIFLLFILPGR